MLFDKKRKALAQSIAPAVESVANAGAAVIGLAIVAVVVSVIALTVAAKARVAA
jgi:hypothetical protein